MESEKLSIDHRGVPWFRNTRRRYSVPELERRNYDFMDQPQFLLKARLVRLLNYWTRLPYRTCWKFCFDVHIPRKTRIQDEMEIRAYCQGKQYNSKSTGLRMPYPGSDCSGKHDDMMNEMCILRMIFPPTITRTRNPQTQKMKLMH